VCTTRRLGSKQDSVSGKGMVDTPESFRILAHHLVVRLGGDTFQDVHVIRVNPKRIMDGGDEDAQGSQFPNDPNCDQSVEHEDPFRQERRSGIFQGVNVGRTAGLSDDLEVLIPSPVPNSTGQALVDFEG